MADNTAEYALSSVDRSYKITPHFNKLRESFQSKIIPGEYICIDGTLVIFKEKLKFKKNISNRRLLYKLGIYYLSCTLREIICTMWKFTVAKRKIEKNIKPFRHGKRLILCVGNYYTSLELAYKLAKKVVIWNMWGTLRSVRKKCQGE